MKIKRVIQDELFECCREYPVVTIFGPRQSGKTTLVKMAFPDKEYRLLEDPDIRYRAVEDPRGFLEGLPNGAIIDEVQRVPELLSYIQGIVDDDDKNCRFILTGSCQPELHQEVSQTLAGRTALLNLLPFSFSELHSYRKEWDALDLCCLGSFPRLHEKGLKAQRFHASYIQTYVERDARSLLNLHDIGRFQTFLRLLAGRVGQIVNYTSLSNDIGVSSTTIKTWIDVLKASFVVYDLQPYYENIRKRMIKSPKIYFTDTGMVCYLLGIQNAQQLQHNPLRGGIYENLIITEVLKMRFNRGLTQDIFFYRDSHGNEVDLVISDGSKLYPIEIKSSKTFTSDYIKGIQNFIKTLGDKSMPGTVIYNGKENFTFKGINIFNPLLHGFHL